MPGRRYDDDAKKHKTPKGRKPQKPVKKPTVLLKPGRRYDD